MSTNHKIVIGDARRMTDVLDGSVHLALTSAPYWIVKDYGSDNQIGYGSYYLQYLKDLDMVWEECFRVLHEGCRLCINIGDQYLSAKEHGRYRILPIHAEIIRSCEQIGFDYMGSIIWQKVSTTNPSGGASIMGSHPFPRNGIVKYDNEFIMLFKKIGKAPEVSKEIKEQSIISNEEWNEYFSGHWKIAGAKQDVHPAMFPLELPVRLIKMFSFVEEVVLDPFLGSGTTMLASKMLGRNSIGYEINEQFLSVIKNKVGFNQYDLFKDDKFEIITQKGEE